MDINLSSDQLDVLIAILELILFIYFPIWVSNELRK